MKPLLVLFLSGASIVCSVVGCMKHSELLMKAGRGLSYVSLGAAMMLVIALVERMLSV